MKNFKSHFQFDKQERSGIFFLLVLIILLQLAYFGFKWFSNTTPSNFRLDEISQARIDSIKLAQQKKDTVKIFPFNPNYITDYKGYTLGMTPQEIDRLHSFRAENQFVNSVEDFQKVTRVSDSLLNAIKPYFKFPEWVTNQKDYQTKNLHKKVYQSNSVSGVQSHKIKDLNAISTEDLRKISGIGEVLSARIIKFRNRLGGFLVDEQLYDVYGLKPDVAQKAVQRFKVLNPPTIKKININTASTEELSSLVYISYQLAQNIVSYRNAHGFYNDLDDLLKISGYPSNKNERIKLYLSIK